MFLEIRCEIHIDIVYENKYVYVMYKKLVIRKMMKILKFNYI